VKHSPKVYFYQVQKKNLINGKRWYINIFSLN
jgi:hypothetical protein